MDTSILMDFKIPLLFSDLKCRVIFESDEDSFAKSDEFHDESDIFTTKKHQNKWLVVDRNNQVFDQLSSKKDADLVAKHRNYSADLGRPQPAKNDGYTKAIQAERFGDVRDRRHRSYRVQQQVINQLRELNRLQIEASKYGMADEFDGIVKKLLGDSRYEEVAKSKINLKTGEVEGNPLTPLEIEEIIGVLIDKFKPALHKRAETMNTIFNDWNNRHPEHTVELPPPGSKIGSVIKVTFKDPQNKFKDKNGNLTQDAIRNGVNEISDGLYMSKLSPANGIYNMVNKFITLCNLSGHTDLIKDLINDIRKRTDIIHQYSNKIRMSEDQVLLMAAMQSIYIIGESLRESAVDGISTPVSLLKADMIVWDPHKKVKSKDGGTKLGGHRQVKGKKVQEMVDELGAGKVMILANGKWKTAAEVGFTQIKPPEGFEPKEVKDQNPDDLPPGESTESDEPKEKPKKKTKLVQKTSKPQSGYLA